MSSIGVNDRSDDLVVAHDPIIRSIARVTRTTPKPHCTDLGNAQRLVRRHGHELRFAIHLQRWLAWDGTRWKVADRGEVQQRASETILSLYPQLPNLPDQERADLLRHAKQSESLRALRAMVTLAETEPGIPVSQQELDADDWLLNLANGTLDLRTGQLRAHDPHDLITKIAPVHFDPRATCPTWEAFLDRIFGGDGDLIGFLQRAIGYSLTGDTSEQVLFFLHGRGANGKSTLLETIRRLLGEYAAGASFAAFLSGRGDAPRNDLARLQGARFVTAAEAASGRHLYEVLVKQLTGGDMVTARYLYREEFEFHPRCKIFLAGNHKPRIEGTDEGIWRRLRLIPFGTTIPEEDRDPELKGKLAAELSGILNWAVTGCLAWQRQGLGTPRAVRAATDEYRGEEDQLGTFLRERCVEGPVRRVASGALYEAYKAWCAETGEAPLSQHDVGRKLTERGFEQQRANKERVRLGLALRPSALVDGHLAR